MAVKFEYAIYDYDGDVPHQGDYVAAGEKTNNDVGMGDRVIFVSGGVVSCMGGIACKFYRDNDTVLHGMDHGSVLYRAHNRTRNDLVFRPVPTPLLVGVSAKIVPDVMPLQWDVFVRHSITNELYTTVRLPATATVAALKRAIVTKLVDLNTVSEQQGVAINIFFSSGHVKMKTMITPEGAPARATPTKKVKKNSMKKMR